MFYAEGMHCRGAPQSRGGERKDTDDPQKGAVELLFKDSRSVVGPFDNGTGKIVLFDLGQNDRDRFALSLQNERRRSRRNAGLPVLREDDDLFPPCLAVAAEPRGRVSLQSMRRKGK
jgi:hypothetical protein